MANVKLSPPLNGKKTTLMEEIAREIFPNSRGTFFCAAN